MINDDLDDGLDYSVDEVDQSEVDESVEAADSAVQSRESDDESDGQVSERKRSSVEEDENEKPLSKRQKKLATSSLHKKKLERMEYDRTQKQNLPKATNDQIVEYLATLIREKNSDLSALELDELYFKKQDFISTEKYQKERTLENFQDFVNSFSKSPKAIILSVSNMRVADVYRSLNGHQNAVKLFSKNKLKEDLKKVEELLSNSKTSKSEKIKKIKNNRNSLPIKASPIEVKYFISTPNRMEKIIEQTDLFFQGKEKLDIFIDASYLDPKDNTIFSSDDATVLCKVLKEFSRKKSSVKFLLF